MKRFPVLLVCVLASACALQKPKAVDPFAVVPAAPKLGLAVVPTQNTRNLIEFAQKESEGDVGRLFARAYTLQGAAIQLQALPKRLPLDDLLKQLRANFGTVVSAASVEAARSAGAPLVALVDVFETLPTTSRHGVPTGEIGIDETVAFLTAAGAPVEKISVSDKETIAERSLFTVQPPLEAAFFTAHDAVLDRFQAALSSSAALQAYAAKAPPAAAPGASFPGLTLAIVPSENTRRAVAKAIAGTFVRDLDLMKPILSFQDRLRGNFKYGLAAASVEDAKKLGVDVIAVADFYEAFTAMQNRFQIAESALFLDAEGDRLDSVAVKEDRSTWEAGGFSPHAVPVTVAAAEDSIGKKLQEALDGSQPLRDYARLKAGGGATAKRSDVDEPRYKSAEDPDKVAVVVGVEGYQSLPAADYAERDAQAVRRHLLALGFPKDRTILLTGRSAGKADLEKYLEAWLPAHATPKSEVFVYFSGHGAPDAKSGQAYLMPWDADATFVESTGYPVRRLYASLGALKARRVVVALDSCFSGAGGRSVLAKGARPLVATTGAEKPASDKLVVLAAASGDEITGTDDRQGHGLFTYYLLRALNERGAAAAIPDLFGSLKTKVQDAARRDNRDQTPQLLSSGPVSADAL